jgi:hypothetical protein
VTGARSLLGAALLPRFARRVLVLAPGCRHPYRPTEWRGALVVIEWGEVQLEFAGQSPRRFGRDALLCFGGLGLSAIYNPGPGPAVLMAVWRRRSPTP